MSYVSEEKLLKSFLKSHKISEIAKADNQAAYYQIEPKGLFGIPDLVINRFDGHKLKETVAFELKLTNWKRALVQAYRYKSFANRVFVLMDQNHIAAAKRNLFDFKRAGVGLIGLDSSGELVVYYRPRYRRPYSAQLRAKHELMVETNLNRNGFIQFAYWFKSKLSGLDLPGMIPL